MSKYSITCDICRSQWPAITTIEAARNYARAHRLHEGMPCTVNGLPEREARKVKAS